MADENKTLTEVFGDIADAIRAKGVSGTMTPAQMPTKVESIPSDKWGVKIEHFLGDIVNGELQAPSGSVCNFSTTDIVSIPTSYFWWNRYRNDLRIGQVSLPNLTTVSPYGMYQAFYGCTNLTSVDLSGLTSVFT